MVKIQVGKRYVRRDGQISGVIDSIPRHKIYPFLCKATGYIYTENGRYYKDSVDGRDLVVKYKEPKVTIKKQTSKGRKSLNKPEKPQLKIEEGKYYKNGKGVVIGPMIPESNDNFDWLCGTTGACFMGSGHSYGSLNSDLHLVEELKISVAEHPVGTVLLNNEGNEIHVVGFDDVLSVSLNSCDEEMIYAQLKKISHERNANWSKVLGTLELT